MARPFFSRTESVEKYNYVTRITLGMLLAIGLVEVGSV